MYVTKCRDHRPLQCWRQSSIKLIISNTDKEIRPLMDTKLEMIYNTHPGSYTYFVSALLKN
jgi:hypothetical protein